MNDWDSLSEQSMRYGPVRLAVPPGFQNLIRLISHEVLREQPKDHVKFIADFLQDVLAIRESTGDDPVLRGELIGRVQAQYAQIRAARGEAETQPRFPTVDSAARGDCVPIVKKDGTVPVETILEGCLETLQEMREVDEQREAAEQGATNELSVPAESMPEDTGLPADESEAPTESGMEPAESGTEPAEAVTELAEPGMELAEPGMELAEQGMESAEPGMEQAESGVEPTESSVEPAELGVEPAELGVEPVETIDEGVAELAETEAPQDTEESPMDEQESTV